MRVQILRQMISKPAVLALVAVLTTGVAQAEQREPEGTFPPEKYVKVAAVAFSPGDAPIDVPQAVVDRFKKQSRDDLVEEIRAAAKNGARMVVTPEFGMIGYPDIPELPPEEDEFQNREQLKPFVESIDGPKVKYFQKLAKELAIWLVVGIAEVDPGDRYFNTLVAVSPEGKVVATYRKINLFEGETKFLSRGSSRSFFDTEFGRVGLFTCFDIHFDHPARDLVRKDHAEIIAFGTSWVGRGGLAAYQSFARSNRVYFVAANHMYFPDTGVISPDGSIQSHIRSSTGPAYGYIPKESRRNKLTGESVDIPQLAPAGGGRIEPRRERPIERRPELLRTRELERTENMIRAMRLVGFREVREVHQFVERFQPKGFETYESRVARALLLRVSETANPLELQTIRNYVRLLEITGQTPDARLSPSYLLKGLQEWDLNAGAGLLLVMNEAVRLAEFDSGAKKDPLAYINDVLAEKGLVPADQVGAYAMDTFRKYAKGSDLAIPGATLADSSAIAEVLGFHSKLELERVTAKFKVAGKDTLSSNELRWVLRQVTNDWKPYQIDLLREYFRLIGNTDSAGDFYIQPVSGTDKLSKILLNWNERPMVGLLRVMQTASILAIAAADAKKPLTANQAFDQAMAQHGLNVRWTDPANFVQSRVRAQTFELSEAKAITNTLSPDLVARFTVDGFETLDSRSMQTLLDTAKAQAGLSNSQQRLLNSYFDLVANTDTTLATDMTPRFVLTVLTKWDGRAQLLMSELMGEATKISSAAGKMLDTDDVYLKAFQQRMGWPMVKSALSESAFTQR